MSDRIDGTQCLVMHLSGPSGVKQSSVLLPFLIAVYVSVRKNMCNNSKNVKSHVFLDIKNVKNVRIV